MSCLGSSCKVPMQHANMHNTTFNLSWPWTCLTYKPRIAHITQHAEGMPTCSHSKEHLSFVMWWTGFQLLSEHDPLVTNTKLLILINLFHLVSSYFHPFHFVFGLVEDHINITYHLTQKTEEADVHTEQRDGMHFVVWLVCFKMCDSVRIHGPLYGRV